MGEYVTALFGEAITPSDSIRDSDHQLKRTIARNTREANKHAQEQKNAHNKMLLAARYGNNLEQLSNAKLIVRQRKLERQSRNRAERSQKVREAVADAEANMLESESVANATDTMNTVNEQMPNNTMALARDFSKAMDMNKMRSEIVREAIDDQEDDEEDEEENEEVLRLMQEADDSVLKERTEKSGMMRANPHMRASSSPRTDEQLFADLQKRARDLQT